MKKLLSNDHQVLEPARITLILPQQRNTIDHLLDYHVHVYFQILFCNSVFFLLLFFLLHCLAKLNWNICLILCSCVLPESKCLWRFTCKICIVPEPYRTCVYGNNSENSNWNEFSFEFNQIWWGNGTGEMGNLQETAAWCD